MIKIAAVVTAVVVALIVIITIAVAKSASQKQENAQATIYKFRAPYFYFLIICIIGLLYVTLKSDKIPYPQTKSGEADVSVKATGRTWSWELSADQIPVNKTVDFTLETEDVNHGFAIYSPEGKILAQAQVMPGYSNRLRVKFDKTGEYKVLCLEYCGAAHHKMMTTFNVVEDVVPSETGEEK